MAFVRIKKIHNKKTGTVYEYAYIVRNTWHKNSTKQSVKSYAGKVYRPIHCELSFEDYLTTPLQDWLDHGPFNDILRTLVRWTLHSHHINSKIVDFSALTVNEGKKPVSFALHEGVLNTYTLRQLFRFSKKEDDRETGIAFAKVFVDAGIAVPQEVFLHLFTQLIEE